MKLKNNMLKSLSIQNFRCFEKFELAPLGRINLFVGKNNSGKTSALEAFYLLCAGQDIEPFTTVMIRRGEYLYEKDKPIILHANHLFHGYGSNDKKSITFKSLDHDDQSSWLSLKIQDGRASPNLLESMGQEVIKRLPQIIQQSEDEKSLEFIDKENEIYGLSLTNDMASDDISNIMNLLKNRISMLTITGEGFKESDNFHLGIPISENGEIQVIDLPRLSYKSSNHAKFISLPTVRMPDLVKEFRAIELNPEEELVQKSLQVIEPRLERIAAADENSFFAKLYGVPRRVPLGNLGEGMRYLLGLSLAIVQVPNGFLIVDDIDTGLHYSALTKMWQLVWETAKKLNIQVFATTHNSDCWQSLADIAARDDVADEDITIHRIEQGLTKTIEFTAPDIQIAVERELEVR